MARMITEAQQLLPWLNAVGKSSLHEVTILISALSPAIIFPLHGGSSWTFQKFVPRFERPPLRSDRVYDRVTRQIEEQERSLITTA